jgi:hypothetical protein
MPVKSLIIDPKTGIQASVVDGEEKNALVVAIRPLKVFENKIKFFVNPSYGYNMNVAAGFSGTPEGIHNGTDSAYWTASVVVGGWVFNSIDQAHTGTKSIDATATGDSDTAQITRGSVINLTNRVAITGWIYISNWDDKDIKRVDIFGWNTAAGLMVGDVVDLKSYIDIGLVDSWQKFAIPLSDMFLFNETIDAIRIKTIDIGAGNAPRYYLDDIQIEETGTVVEFNIEPADSTWLHVNNYSIFMADACSSVLVDATMPYLSYDKFLSVPSLSVGILYKRVVGEKVTLSFPFKNLGEILMFPGATIEDYGSDGTNTFFKIFVDLKEPIVLKSENADKISFTILDDLSPLLKFVISANCKEELR